MNRALVRRLLWLLPLLLATQANAQSAAPEFPNPGKASMSRDNQHALGLEVAAQVYQQMPVLPDSSPETQYIRQLGQRLVATIPQQYSWPFEFHVVAQKEINAFALPGGPMFINLGTITSSANEAELAGVMGHEMAHVYMQHSAKQAGKSQTTSMLAGIASAVLGGVGGGGLVGQLGQMGIQMGAQGLMMKYSRHDESQADSVGAIILYKAGYNPQAMADFFKTLEAQGGGGQPEWLSDHPEPGNRSKSIQKQIAGWQAENYTVDSPSFQNVRQQAMAVKAYSAEEIAQGAKSGQWASFNQKNGAALSPAGGNSLPTTATESAPNSPPNAAPVSLQSVLPSQRMSVADLGPVKVHHPENWKVTMPQKQGEFVTIAPHAGITGNGVGYGVLLNGIAPRQPGATNIDEITSQLVQQMQQNNGLEPEGHAQRIIIGGVEGRSVMLQSLSPFPTAEGQQQMEQDWLVTLPRSDGSVIFLVLVAPALDFDRFQPTYQAMLKSLQFQ